MKERDVSELSFCAAYTQKKSHNSQTRLYINFLFVEQPILVRKLIDVWSKKIIDVTLFLRNENASYTLEKEMSKKIEIGLSKTERLHFL